MDAELHTFKKTRSIFPKKWQNFLFSKFKFILKLFTHVQFFSTFSPTLLCLLRLQGLMLCSAFDELESWRYLWWWEKESSISIVFSLKIFQQQMQLHTNRISRIGNFPNIQKYSEKWAYLQLFYQNNFNWIGSCWAHYCSCREEFSCWTILLPLLASQSCKNLGKRIPIVFLVNCKHSQPRESWVFPFILGFFFLGVFLSVQEPRRTSQIILQSDQFGTAIWNTHNHKCTDRVILTNTEVWAHLQSQMHK